MNRYASMRGELLALCAVNDYDMMCTKLASVDGYLEDYGREYFAIKLAHYDELSDMEKEALWGALAGIGKAVAGGAKALGGMASTGAKAIGSGMGAATKAIGSGLNTARSAVGSGLGAVNNATNALGVGAMKAGIKGTTALGGGIAQAGKTLAGMGGRLGSATSVPGVGMASGVLRGVAAPMRIAGQGLKGMGTGMQQGGQAFLNTMAGQAGAGGAFAAHPLSAVTGAAGGLASGLTKGLQIEGRLASRGLQQAGGALAQGAQRAGMPGLAAPMQRAATGASNMLRKGVNATTGRTMQATAGSIADNAAGGVLGSFGLPAAPVHHMEALNMPTAATPLGF